MKTCKDCIHYDVCGKKPPEDTPFSAEQYCPDNFKDKELIVELPFIAMIEQTIENGKFCKKHSEQKFNGRYCVVYLDKEKWASPLIDICGTRYYNKDEAQARVQKIRSNKK